MGNELTSACSGARDKAPACALEPCRADCAGWQVRHALAPAYGLVAVNADGTTRHTIHVTRFPIGIDTTSLVWLPSRIRSAPLEPCMRHHDGAFCFPRNGQSGYPSGT